jgi:tetratricopeptide (TPR) repeat protein
MSTKSDAGSAGLTLRLERQVNAACRRFEAAWRAGARPRLEDFLADCPDAARTALFAELLALELDYRGGAGEAPTAEEYRARFPGHEALIDDAFGTAAQSTVRSPAGGGAAAAGPPVVPGYEVLDQLGQGGMGAVWRGRDRRLRRDVALKVMKAALAGHPHLERRFLEEAQVASQLAHPAIPPVHELGTLPDGRPYIAMKLVQGRTLAELLEARSGPADDLPRLLGAFEQVCQALAYAHARGVIHRDLKPSNVMVGAFGEVQVMDWGLAKVLVAPPGAAADPPGRTVETVRTADLEGATQEGSVLGTPAYMAPEQARGEVERPDRRCDVFGLGAILCELLTGQPPYVGTTEEVRAQAEVGHLAPARERLAACGADAELAGLAWRCLSARAEERPEDAGEVAAAVAAHLAGVQERLRRAELERAAAEARAVEERKRRRVALALAAAVLSLVLVGGGGAAWWWQERTAVVRDTEAALAEAAGHQAAGRWPEARAALERAAGRLGGAGPADLRHRLEVAQAELALVNRLDAIRQRQATWVEGHFDYRTTAQDYAAAFQKAGLGKMGDDEEAVAARVRASGVAGALVAALDAWAAAAEQPESRAWLLGVARRVAPDPWGGRFRDPDVWQDRQELRALADEALRDGGAKLADLSPQVLSVLGTLLKDAPEAIPLLRAARRRYPSDFWINLDLANALSKAKQTEEAVGYCLAAVSLRPEAAAAHYNLGLALHDKGDLNGAIAEYHKAIDINPKDANAHNNLGNALYLKKDRDGAIAEYKKAIEIDPKHAPAHSNLGLVLYESKKDVDGALREYRLAIALAPKYAPAHYNLGNALADKQDLDGAIAAYKEAIALAPKYAPAHYNLGNALFAKKDLDGAIAAYKEAINLDPKLAQAHGSLGVALLHRGRFVEAGTEIRRCLDLLPERDPLRKFAAERLRQCERLVALDGKLAAVLGGQAEPADAAERLALGQLCGQYKRWHAAASRFYADAFAADPKPTADLRQQHRYNGACSAALAAAGRADDAEQLPDKAAVRLRQQALDWLRADLALYVNLAGREEPAATQFVRERMRHWQQDTDLASVRDKEAIDLLPDDEGAAWRRLWEDVAVLRHKLEDKK